MSTTTTQQPVEPVILHSGWIIYLPKAEVDAMSIRQIVKLMRRFDRAAVKSFGKRKR